MAQVGFSCKGGLSFTTIADELDASFSRGRFLRILKEGGEIAYQEAYKLCPIDTGWMQGQIKLEKGATDMYVLSCFCDYASYNEYGFPNLPVTVPDPPSKVYYKSGYHPFLRIAILKGEEYINREIDKRIRKGLKYGK